MSGIAATTGFQRKNISNNDLNELLTNAFNKDKKIEYINTSLRSALEIYKKGGHVTKSYRDQRFRLFYDGRRRLLVSSEILNNLYEGNLD